jgi:nucleoid-associated protein YgaU
MRSCSLTRRQKAGRLHQLNIFASIAIIAIIATLSISTHLFDSFRNLSESNSRQTIVSYKISTGDTLWTLASRSVNKDEDVRDKIIAIQRLNDISASQQLYPGQIIQIPVNQSPNEGFRLTMNR